jgi:hypothetical protein
VLSDKTREIPFWLPAATVCSLMPYYLHFMLDATPLSSNILTE